MKKSWVFLAFLAGCGAGGGDGKSLVLGKELLAKGKHEAAVVELKKATEQDKNSLEAWMRLGDAYSESKKTDEALAAYVVAKRIDRHSIAPHLAHAKLQIELGRIREAILELTLVTEMDPKNLYALSTLGRISQLPHKQADGSTGVTKLDLERAEMNLEAAATLAPDNAQVKQELAKLRAKLGK